MTLTEFVSSYERCAINNIPKECMDNIFEVVGIGETAQYMRDRLSGWMEESSQDTLSFRFQNGRWVNFMRPPQIYRPGHQQSFSLEAVIGFDELDLELEDIDLSMLLELC